ncbi:MAG: YfhO family protein [Tannerella sp.]|nr:YfhO family protein [Tannerella sp.]
MKKSIPHIVAVLFFAGLAVAYFAPEFFENKTLAQGDAKSFSGMGKDLADYHQQTGEYAFWSNRMFGGMPANYTYSPPFVNIFSHIGGLTGYVIQQRNPNVIFLYLIGFYILLLSMGCKPWLSAAGAAAYTFASFNLISLEAGHINKCLVMATMAPVIGGIILCYRKKYLWGIIVTLIFTGLNILWSHQQISYYLLIMILLLAVVYLIYAIREHTLKDYLKSSAILIAVAALAIAPEAGKLITTADYTKETMRGGAVLQNTAEGEKASSGLDIDYAFQWSYGKAETMTLLIPNFYGASSHYNIGRDSETYRVLRPTGQADQFCRYAPMYWGDQPFTAGPVYVGATICFLFLLGLQIVKGRERWWLLAATVISIMLAWGRHFSVVNDFLFYHLPLYSKFRTPSMALAIAEVTMVTLAILAVKTFMERKDRAGLLKPLYIAAGITGGLCLIYALFGGALMNFSSFADENYKNYPELLNALEADRRHMLTSDAWRSLLFIALSAGTLWYWIGKPRPALPAAILCILILADLWMVDKRFINYDSFLPRKRANEIVETPADRQILQDKDPSYRVLNLTRDPFNESETSYFHKSIGGYSPAKLRRYQDIIDHYLARGVNMNILNMLNGRYVIVPSQEGPRVQRNGDALGNAWFADTLQWVNSPDEEIVALKDFDPAKTAIIDTAWKNRLPGWESLQGTDSTAVIRLADYANPGYLIYESSSSTPRLAVFSEVYYKTWHAYIDGVETPPVRVNYILRGLAVPAGNHTIEFKCIDHMYYKGARISMIASIVVGIVLASLFGYAIWTLFRRKEKSGAAAGKQRVAKI